MNLPYENIQDLAAELKRRYYPGFYSLPYNRFDVDHSQHWWLSPTPEKAAFHHAKIGMTTNEDWVESGNVFVGANIEKGVLHEGNWHKNNIMKKEWFWHRFLKLANLPLASAIKDAEARIEGNMQVSVTCGMLVSNHDWAHVVFEVDSDALHPTHYKEGDRTLSNLAKCADFSAFAQELQVLDGSKTAWQWIDIHIGTSFTLNPSGEDDTERCAAMLAPFTRWMLGTPEAKDFIA